MSLAYEASVETVSPFRYILELPPRLELGLRANLALIQSINLLFYH